MDSDRFAGLVRMLAERPSRPRAFGALSVAGFGALAAVSGEPDANARKRKRKKCRPEPRAFCAGKSECVADAPCQASGPACVITGGASGSAFLCALPCPDPIP